MADALEAARARVAAAADSLLSRSPYFTTFDETKGSVDYERWRKDLTSFSGAAGQDFVLALTTADVINPAAALPPGNINDDTVTARPVVSMPLTRQYCLLSIIRATLPAGGESLTLIESCVHAGGQITLPSGININQALRLLDIRWRSEELARVDPGDTSKLLYAMKWPSEVSVDAYNTYYNLAVSRASKSHFNPINEDDASQNLRSTWWHIIAEPPVTSTYFAAAQLARSVTNQQRTTTAHREAFRTAMVREVETLVKAGVGRPVGGMARGPVGVNVGNVNFGGTAPSDAIDAASFDAPAPLTFPPGLNVAGLAVGPPRPFGGAPGASGEMRKCPKCPLLADGTPTMHPRGFQCSTVAQCDVCKSSYHVAHGCFIATGVDKKVKMSAEMVAELTRLHNLYKAGQFNWRTTPTTLSWLLKFRSSQAASGLSFEVSYDNCAELEYVVSLGLETAPPVAPPLLLLSRPRWAW